MNRSRLQATLNIIDPRCAGLPTLSMAVAAAAVPWAACLICTSLGAVCEGNRGAVRAVGSDVCPHRSRAVPAALDALELALALAPAPVLEGSAARLASEGRDSGMGEGSGC